MVAFRKVFPVLAIVALLLGTALTASAQAPLRCTANAGVPPIVRAEGYTELVGDLVVECTGGNPANAFDANFQLFLNTNITSRLISGQTTEALLLIDEPGLPRLLADGTTAGTPTPFCTTTAGCTAPEAGATWQQGQATVVQGRLAAQNALVWEGIHVTPPGSNTRVFRFTNVRANAYALGASQTLIPTQIVAYIAVSPSATLPIDNPQQTVGYVQRGLSFDVTDCGGGSPTVAGLAQCQSVGVGDAVGGLRFTEGFATSFKPQIITPTDTDPTDQRDSLPGQVFNSESGFVRQSLAGLDPRVGVADTGTRLAARFVNIPAGVNLYVTNTQVGGTGIQAELLSGVAIDPGSPVEPGTVDIDCGDSSVAGTQVPLTAGAGQAVWVITNSNPSAIESLLFNYAISYEPNVGTGSPALGTGQVVGTFAPFYAAGTAAERASGSLPIPRFAPGTGETNLFRISACVTNLLFPYVTNWAGFDTGLAIANTSQDPFSNPNSRLQSGTCTINYYGTLANGSAPTRTSETTDRAIGAGETLTFILSGGGGYGLEGNAGFQGYIIAQCNFQYAHGFAFITDGPIGQAQVAQGYLALVLDGGDANTRRSGVGATGEVRGN
jgi:hypothetical protein